MTSRTIDDGAVVWHCERHLEAGERAIFDALVEEGWEGPRPPTIH